MSMFKTISPGTPRFQEIEFSLLLGWALLFPDKIGYSYCLGFISLLAAFMLAKAPALKSIAVTRFSSLLLLFNAVLIFGAFFSPHPHKSLLFVADFLLLSLWLALFFLEKEDTERYLRLAALVISLSSLGMVVFFALQKGRGPVTPFFENPALQGIASALAVLVFLHGLLQKYGHAGLLLLVLNAGAVVISASPAALLGLGVLVLAMIARDKRRRLVWLFPILLLLAVAAGFLQRRETHPPGGNEYALNRWEIWSMSARMYRHYPWMGVGPDLFSEAARPFNIPLENGPARFFKLPASPQSDYWKVIVENGLPGLAFVLLFLFFTIRRLLAPPLFSLARWLLALLLAQMLLFNLAFNFFFLLLLLLLLRDLFPAGRRFIALRPGARVFFSGLLVFVLLTFYLLPFLADRCLDRAVGEKDFVRRLAWLQKSSLLSPMDERGPLAKVALLRAFALSRPGPALKAPNAGAAWAAALENARRAQRLDGNSVEALVLEAELFRDILDRGDGYPALGEEILEPLRRAVELAPFDPFLKLQQANVLRRFGRAAESRLLAQSALDLEPDYAVALVFIHELDGLPADNPTLRERLASIREKADRLKAPPGSYLFKLHLLPTATWGQGVTPCPPRDAESRSLSGEGP
jgi:hypothetical protein